MKVKVIALNHFRLRFMSMSMSMSSSPALSLSSTLFHGGGGAPLLHIKKNKNNNNNKFLLSLSLSSSLSPFCTRTLFPESRFDGIAAGPHGVVQPMSMSSQHHHQQQQQDASASHNHLLQVVLVSPQIPGNTGCIARTCAASGVKLHLVEPLGFQIDDTKLKRAGLDYWPYVVVKVHSSWAEFREYFSLQEGEKRLLAFTKRGTAIHSDFTYRPGDWLVFGSETSGLPADALLDCKSETYGGGAIKIPMVDTYVRCLNLSVSVGIAVYEAARQLNYEQLEYSPETCMNGEDLFIAEDIFA